MRTTTALTFSMLKNIQGLAAIVISLFLSTTASATIINFDDLDPVYNEEFPCWCDNPLSDEYIDKGLLIHGSWVVGAKPNNNMLTSNWGGLEFVDELPTFLSLNITSHYGDAIYLDFYGESGYLHTITTSGWQGLEEISSPVIPNEFVSFTSDVGIKSVSIYGFYNMRIGASIDNITFSRTSVPEPSSIAFMSLGLLGLLLRRFKV